MDIPMWTPHWWMGSETMSSHHGCCLNSLASCFHMLHVQTLSISWWQVWACSITHNGFCFEAIQLEHMHGFKQCRQYEFGTKPTSTREIGPNDVIVWYSTPPKILQHVRSLLHTVVWLQCLEHIMQGSKLIRGHRASPMNFPVLAW